MLNQVSQTICSISPGRLHVTKRGEYDHTFERHKAKNEDKEEDLIERIYEDKEEDIIESI